jgi:hypothetical protein
MRTESLLEHRSERELLRICASRQPSEAAAGLIRKLVSGETDWDYLSRAAETHRLIPLLYRNLTDICEHDVPANIIRRFQRAYITNAAHNLRLTGELLRLIAILEGEGIQVVPFKGPVLAELLFQNIALRQFGDLDILVRPRDVNRAKQLLLDDGYQPEFQLSGKIEAEYIRSEHAFQFHKSANSFVIELHWRFGARDQVFPVDPNEIWSRLERRTFQGREILSLAPEDLLLYLCVHGAKHGWGRLEWICCISELVRLQSGLDWSEIMLRARNSGAERALYVALLLAESLADLNLPSVLAEAMRSDVAAQALAWQAAERLFVEEPNHSRREVYRHTFYLRARERWIDRARILVYSSARVPHPLAKDWDLFKVPASMSFLYYLLRPIRLMREYGFRRLRAMLGANSTF